MYRKNTSAMSQESLACILTALLLVIFTNAYIPTTTISTCHRSITSRSSSCFSKPPNIHINSFGGNTAFGRPGTRSSIQMGLFSVRGSISSAHGAPKPTTSISRLFMNKSSVIRNSIKKVISKSCTKLNSTIFRKRKYIRNLATAAVCFCTILSSTVHQKGYLQPNPSSISDNYYSNQNVQSVVMDTTKSADSIQTHLNSFNRGGEGISASKPSNLMKRAAHLAKNKEETLGTSFQRQTELKTTNIQKSMVRKGLTKISGGSSSRNGQEHAAKVVEGTSKKIKKALVDLQRYMKGAKTDTLLLLLATSLVTPLCKKLGTSPIIGFLAAGMVIGPNALGLISGIHNTETLAELGIVFFLFEMGIELSFDRLRSMKRDVFGLGFSQFALTALTVAAVGSLFNIPANALVVLGGGLALSSSAFVLQLLKDNNQLASRFGKASFGVLLFQDLAVVPLLVVTPILASGGKGLASALSSALIKAGIALSSITFAGRFLLNPLFKIVAGSNSQEAFLGVILLTVLSMSFMTEGLGLSNTLGAFLAGVLLSETKYRYQVEADIAPFRAILLGLFFVTVGFEIDLRLISSNLPLVSAIVASIVLIKSTVTTLLSLAFGLSLSTSQQTGLMLSQGGEFAFVAFGLARNLGILDPAMTKLMLTSVSVTMAITPFLADFGAKMAKRLEEDSDFAHYLGEDRDATEIKESDDFVVVVGYGIVGKVVCDLLDKKIYRYVGLGVNPNKAIQARNKGLPVFYGDIGRPEVADAFNVGKAKAIIVTIADKDETNRVVISLRRQYPETKIFARARNADHAQRLQSNLDVIAMVPVVPEDNVLVTLPFGGAVLRSLGSAPEEVKAILERKRKEILDNRVGNDGEEKMVLTQLGILSESEESTDDSEEKDSEVLEEEPTSSEVARAAAEEKKDSAPMVAEVIEAAAGKITEEKKDSAPVVAEVIETIDELIDDAAKSEEEENIIS